MWEHFGCCLLELMCYVDDWFIDLYVIILVEMKPVYWGLKENQGTMITHVPISFRMVEYDCCYDWMMNAFAIILIEMKSEYWGLKGNQGTVQMDHYEVNEFGINYESLWLNVKLSFIRLKNSYLHL